MFDSVMLSSLRNVRGDLLLQSSNTVECSSISSSIVGGNYSCNGAASQLHSQPSLSEGAAVGIAVAGVIFCASVLAAVLLWRARRRRRGVQEIQIHEMPPAPPPKERKSYGFYDHKLDGGLQDTAYGYGDNALAMEEMRQKRDVVPSLQQPRHELSAGKEPEVHELPTSPTGAAQELACRMSREE